MLRQTVHLPKSYSETRLPASPPAAHRPRAAPPDVDRHLTSRRGHAQVVARAQQAVLPVTDKKGVRRDDEATDSLRTIRGPIKSVFKTAFESLRRSTHSGA
jgi:hypothetical protein